MNLKSLWNSSHTGQHTGESHDGIAANARWLACDHRLQMLQRELIEMGRADEEQRLEDSPHDAIAHAVLDVSPLQKQSEDMVGDDLHVIAPKHLARKAHVNDVVALEPMKVGKISEQISDGDDVLTLHPSSFNGIDPLLGGPSPERTPALSRLTQEEQQHILAMVGLDARVVERIVQRLHQPVERRTEVHRSPVPVKAIRLRIACQQILFAHGERGTAVVSVKTDRPGPGSVVCLLRPLLLWSPLSTGATLKER